MGGPGPHRHGVRRWLDRTTMGRARAQILAGDRRPLLQGRPWSAGGPRARVDPPRLQARQHPGRPRWTGPRGRLRSRPHRRRKRRGARALGRCDLEHRDVHTGRDRGPRRLARVHGPRAVSDRSRHRGRRSIRLLRVAVRGPLGCAPLRRRQRRGRGRGHLHRSGPRPAAPARPGPHPRCAAPRHGHRRRQALPRHGRARRRARARSGSHATARRRGDRCRRSRRRRRVAGLDVERRSIRGRVRGSDGRDGRRLGSEPPRRDRHRDAGRRRDRQPRALRRDRHRDRRLRGALGRRVATGLLAPRGAHLPGVRARPLERPAAVPRARGSARAGVRPERGAAAARPRRLRGRERQRWQRGGRPNTARRAARRSHPALRGRPRSGRPRRARARGAGGRGGEGVPRRVAGPRPRGAPRRRPASGAAPATRGVHGGQRRRSKRHGDRVEPVGDGTRRARSVRRGDRAARARRGCGTGRPQRDPGERGQQRRARVLPHVSHG